MKRLSFLLVLVLLAALALYAAPSQTQFPPIEIVSAEVVEAQRNEVTVYITDSGERYHVSSCRYLRQSKHPLPLSEAKRQGYTPCKVCQPPR